MEKVVLEKHCEIFQEFQHSLQNCSSLCFLLTYTCNYFVSPVFNFSLYLFVYGKQGTTSLLY